MRTKVRQLFIVLAAVAAGLTSCRDTDVYDPDGYKDLMDFLSPVGDIDDNQNWRMTQRHTVNVTINATGVNAQQLLILTPHQTSDAYVILAQQYVSNGQTATANFSVPIIADTLLYAALYDGHTYTLLPFTAEQDTIDFSSPERSVQRIELLQQGYTYCFEDGMPEPGDYDYNDLVLRVVKERTAERELKLSVTLAAIGTTMPMAAAIRLAGIQFSDIEHITASGSSNPFVGGYPQERIYLEKADTLQQARNGEAVIALFEDAHWALDGRNLSVNNGIVMEHYTYNTRRIIDRNDNTSKQRTARVVTYTITFASASVLDGLAMDDIDPFMLKDYNGGIWEVHIPAYEAAQVLWDYSLPDASIMPWAIAIPTSAFRYPLEGVYLGKYKDDVISGAYMNPDHSFGQWAANKEIAKDWYLYPTNQQVY